MENFEQSNVKHMSKLNTFFTLKRIEYGEWRLRATQFIGKAHLN